MVNIQQINDPEAIRKEEEHQKLGGAFRISVFKISKNYQGVLPDEYMAHLATARQTLEKENYESNLHFNKVAGLNQRSRFGFMQTDYGKLDPSGIKLDVQHFLGPQFDLQSNKLLIQGKSGYHYHDQEDTPEHQLDLNASTTQFRELYPENKGGFVHACLETPYGMDFGKDFRKRGEYLLDFMDYFFGDLSQIEVYAWSTDCSPIFDPGHEWWGSYFWTVYNPSKQWYVGMIASETD